MSSVKFLLQMLEFCDNRTGGVDLVLEGWMGGRYGVWHADALWRDVLTRAGFSELEHYYRPPGVPRARQAWLASVWRKAAS